MEKVDLLTVTGSLTTRETQAHWHGVAARAELPEDANWRKRKRAYRRGVLAYKREWTPEKGWRN
jgi:hypothetical protein